MSGLKERFERFVKTVDGFESIDELLMKHDLIGKKRADYLVLGRSIIMEQKVLEVDPLGKPQEFVDSLMAQGRFIAYGKISTGAMFSKLSDGQKLQRDLILRLTKVLDGIVSNADKQAQGTREIFSIPSATSILVLLNEKARMLSPDVIHYGLAYMYQKKSADGDIRYPNNNGVIVISEARRGCSTSTKDLSCHDIHEPPRAWKARSRGLFWNAYRAVV